MWNKYCTLFGHWLHQGTIETQAASSWLSEASKTTLTPLISKLKRSGSQLPLSIALLSLNCNWEMAASNVLWPRVWVKDGAISDVCTDTSESLSSNFFLPRFYYKRQIIMCSPKTLGLNGQILLLANDDIQCIAVPHLAPSGEGADSLTLYTWKTKLSIFKRK